MKVQVDDGGWIKRKISAPANYFRDWLKVVRNDTVVGWTIIIEAEMTEERGQQGFI